MVALARRVARRRPHPRPHRVVAATASALVLVLAGVANSCGDSQAPGGPNEPAQAASTTPENPS